MKRVTSLSTAALALAVSLAAILCGCSLLPPLSGSGRLTRSAYPVSGFTGIQASQSFQVSVVPDPSYSVTITCDDNLLRYLVVERSGTSLRLGLVPGYMYSGVTLVAEVHMPVVEVIDASGASTVRLASGLAASSRFAVVLSGASTCEVASAGCGDASFDISGASLVTCDGTASGLTLILSGASRANLLNCAGSRATVTLSGSSEAWVDVGTRPIDLSASGASTLYYGGTPTLAAHDLSGGSRIVRVR
jgi:hypothetical protein